MLPTIEKINFQFFTSRKLLTTLFLNMILSQKTPKIILFKNDSLKYAALGNSYINMCIL